MDITKDGYDRDGYNIRGYDKEGYNRLGFDMRGYDKNDCDRKGNYLTYNLFMDILIDTHNQYI